MHAQEITEWPEEVEVLIDQFESGSAEQELTREQQALMDVYETVPIFQGQDCLHDFWKSGIEHQRVINSFELMGATSLVDPINASRWCETRSEDRAEYTETEEEHLASIEEELEIGLDDLLDLVLAFIEDELT